MINGSSGTFLQQTNQSLNLSSIRRQRISINEMVCGGSIEQQVELNFKNERRVGNGRDD
jgi:hypothetical protein